MAKQKAWYLHTLDGRPAAFNGQDLHFLNRYGRGHNFLVPDLRTLYSEQRRASSWRDRNGLPNHWKYGYVRVHLPVAAG